MKKALIIDDNKEFVDLMKLFISRDFILDVCYNLEEINSLEENAHYDLILTDYNLGLNQGKEITDALHARINTTNSKILLISGSIDTKLAALEIKADAFLEKPFKLADLKVKLAELQMV